MKDTGVKFLSLGLLPIQEFRSWYNLIQEDKVSQIEQRLINLDGNDKSKLLNGRFQYEDESDLIRPRRGIEQPMFLITKPWCLAATFSAHKCMKLFYQLGVDTAGIDVNGEFCVCRVFLL